MASDQKVEEVELLSLAIKSLMEEKESKASDRSTHNHGGDNRLLLSQLLSQVESMREEVIKNSQLSAQQEDENGTKEESRVETEEKVMKELKEVKRQNLITHCLVSAMIVLTVVWQLSEVSIILKIRDGLTNPFKFIGRFLKNKTTSAVQNQIEATELPHLHMPALPHVNLPDLDFDDE